MRISDWSSDVCSSDLTVPGRGRLVVNGEDARLAQVLAMGCWTPVETFGLDDAAAAGGKPFDWSARLVEADGSVFAVLHAGSEIEIGRASCRERVCQYV